MDVFYNVVALFGGLSLFLYGMRIMGDSLKSSSGGAMKASLEKVTNNPVIGFIFGMLVTCMIQSSTATIVLTVGLVGAGFLSFRQSVGIVMGANVGTAITAQIIRLMDVQAGAGSLLYFFKADNLAPMALIVGIILIMFVKGDHSSNTGTIFMGFGILFVGLINMSSAVGTMGDALSGMLTAFEDNYFLGFLSGVLVTGVIQSSSAVIGILQSVASSVGVTFASVFAVIIGVNIGDCLTTFIVSRIGAKPSQIRTALVHVIYNIFAAILIIVVVSVARMTGLLSDEFWTMPLNSGGVANIHGIFRLVPAVCLLPFSNVFANLAEKIVKDEPVEEEDAEIEANLRELDYHLVTNPGLAQPQVAHLINHMADTALHNYQAAMDQIYRYEEKRDARISQREDLLDRMADACNRYIVELSHYTVRESDSIYQQFLIQALTKFERIGDLAVNINKSVKSLRSEGGVLSEAAMAELNVCMQAVSDILNLTASAYKSLNMEDARRVEPMEEVIDELTEALRHNHIERMTAHICEIATGIHYENIISNLERISDQCSDLAVYVISRTDISVRGNEHQYIHNLHHSNNAVYLEQFKDYYDKYFGMMYSALLTVGNEEEEKDAAAAEAEETADQQTSTEDLRKRAEKKKQKDKEKAREKAKEKEKEKDKEKERKKKSAKK